jgi:hypothetical protein
MNERIKELMKQCETEYSTSYEPCYDMEKFAELLIRKCLTICEELGDKGMDGHYCADEISRTFRS